MRMRLRIDGETFDVHVPADGSGTVEVDGALVRVSLRRRGDGYVVEGTGLSGRLTLSRGRVQLDGSSYPAQLEHLRLTSLGEAEGDASAGANEVLPPMPGRVVALRVKAGDAVRKGQTLVVLEAMKMQNEIVAPRDATVADVRVRAGQAVETGQVLLVLG